jgi:molybdate transport system permease protein
MDWFPLYNSLRIAAISTVAVFFLGLLAAYYIARLPKLVKGVLDVVLTLPLVLPPTVVGWLLLVLLGPKRPLGSWVQATFGVKLVMTWWSAIFATVVVAFPLMYRTARGAFESFDENLADAGRTLGRSNTWVFWRVRMPCCR